MERINLADYSRRPSVAVVGGSASAAKRRVSSRTSATKASSCEDKNSELVENCAPTTSSNLSAYGLGRASAASVNSNASSANATGETSGSRRKRIVRFVEELRRRSSVSAKMTVDLVAKCRFPLMSQTSSESNLSSSNEEENLCLNFAATVVSAYSSERCRMNAAGSSSSGGIGGGNSYVAHYAHHDVARHAAYNSNKNNNNSNDAGGAVVAAQSHEERTRSACLLARNNSNITTPTTRCVSLNEARFQRYGARPAGGSLCSLSTKITHASLASRYRCLCGSCHVVVGTKLFLVLYLCLSLCGALFGMVSTLVWTLVPIFIIPMATRALCSSKPKYLYPFLIITVVHVFVCIIMAFIVTVFALYNYDKISLIVAQNLRGSLFARDGSYGGAKQQRALNAPPTSPSSSSSSSSASSSSASSPSSHSSSSSSSAASAPAPSLFLASPSSPTSASYDNGATVFTEGATVLRNNCNAGTITVFIVGLTVLACVALALIFAWQTTVISSCIEYYDVWAFQTESHASDRLYHTTTHADSRSTHHRSQLLGTPVRTPGSCNGGGGGSGMTRFSTPNTPYLSCERQRTVLPPRQDSQSNSAHSDQCRQSSDSGGGGGDAPVSQILKVARSMRRSTMKNKRSLKRPFRKQRSVDSPADTDRCLSAIPTFRGVDELLRAHKPSASSETKQFVSSVDVESTRQTSAEQRSANSADAALSSAERLATKFSDATTTTWIPSAASEGSLACIQIPQQHQQRSVTTTHNNNVTQTHTIHTTSYTMCAEL